MCWENKVREVKGGRFVDNNAPAKLAAKAPTHSAVSADGFYVSDPRDENVLTGPFPSAGSAASHLAGTAPAGAVALALALTANS
jgi:hypothetical protein